MQGQFENKMVDPVNSTLGKMLLDGITPVVMVLRTPLVEESCLKNGLSFVQMLSPFSIFNNIDGDLSFSLLSLVCANKLVDEL